MENEVLKIWTDGACFPNPGRGGWAWVTEDEMFASGHEEQSTNNRMEIMAVIKAIEPFRGRQIEIITDSQFVVNSATRWRSGWEARGWATKEGHEVKNRPLWEELFSLIDLNFVRFTWVRGHSGEYFNELADQIAIRASRNIILQSLDEIRKDGQLIYIDPKIGHPFRGRFSSGRHYSSAR